MLHSVVTPKCSTDIENQTHIRTHSLHARWFHFLPKKMSRKKKLMSGIQKLLLHAHVHRHTHTRTHARKGLYRHKKRNRMHRFALSGKENNKYTCTRHTAPLGGGRC